MGTVHSAKGEIFEAVMLVLKRNDRNRRNYANILKRNIEEDEELRILYVGMTRPRKLLILSVPHNAVSVWKQKFALEKNSE